MAKEINLNADMGEGFGAYDIGDDAGLLKIIRSASIACGFHAGDPVVMQRVVTQAGGTVRVRPGPGAQFTVLLPPAEVTVG